MIKLICLVSYLHHGSVLGLRKIYSVCLVHLERIISFLKDMGEGKQNRWINKSFLNAHFNHPVRFLCTDCVPFVNIFCLPLIFSLSPPSADPANV